jgi:protein-disulfide isomerase
MKLTWLRLMSGWTLAMCLTGLSPAHAGEAEADVAATIGGVPIAFEEINQLIGARVAALNEQIYQLQRQTVEGLINERLLTQEATRRGISTAELLDAEVARKTEPVSDAEVESFYQANESRLPTQEADLRQRIRLHLHNQRLNARQSLFFGELRARANVKILLKPPAIFRAALDLDGAPIKGRADAPVTIVKFEDFHCPFCKEAQHTLAQLLSKYPDRVKLAHKDFPIDELHPAARAGHVAARCAAEQGKFWSFHDLLFANGPKAAPADLRNYAQAAGVDITSFEQCLASGRFVAAVEKDVADGKRAGVTGTPAFYINGRMLAGAQPIEAFVKLIEEELAQRR